MAPRLIDPCGGLTLLILRLSLLGKVCISYLTHFLCFLTLYTITGNLRYYLAEYMLGENILVAPVVEEGATTLDIYLPIGNWRSGVTNLTYVGPGWLRNVDAPLDIVNFYIKE